MVLSSKDFGSSVNFELQSLAFLRYPFFLVMQNMALLI